MTTQTRTTTLDLDQVAVRFADDGVESVLTELDQVAALARAVGITTPSVEIMTDGDAPDVVRARAFGLVSGHLQRRHHSATPSDVLVTVA